MIVAHIAFHIKEDESARLPFALFSGLNKEGVSSELVLFNDDRAFLEAAKAAGIAVCVFDKKTAADWGLVFKLRAYLKNKKVDVVHAHTPASFFYSAAAARLAGIPCVATCSLTDKKSEGGFLLNLMKRVVVFSNKAKEEMFKRDSRIRDKIHVIYPGVDGAAFLSCLSAEEAARVKAELKLKEDSFIIGHQGDFTKDQDQLTLLKTFKKLYQRKFNGDLLMIGDGPLRADLEKQARDLRISDRVHFLGAREDSASLYKIFDVFALTAYREGGEAPLLWAMASGKPVIATSISPYQEIVLDNTTGVLVPCGFPERVQSAIMRFYANRSLIEQYGEAGQKRFQEYYSLHKMVEAYKALYLSKERL